MFVRMPAVAVAASVALCASAQAQSNEGAALPQIEVNAINAGGSLTQPGVAKQRETINQNAGSVGFVDSETFANRFAGTLRDVLKDSPGVFVENRYGQELRLSIRGSGLARGFHLRGIEVLQDGIPVNAADGSGDFYQIDPLGLRSAEIYKGGNGLAYGSSTLGGAVNFVTPTAYTAIAPNILRLDGGSFGTVRGNAQFSRAWGDVDTLVNGTVTHSDGFRDHSRTQAEQFNANIGYRIGPNLETRFYLGAYIVDQQLPGSLTLTDALNDPRKANPGSANNIVGGNQQRNTITERIANRTTLSLDDGKIDFDTWAIHKNLYHPIFQVIDQDGWTYGVSPHYTGEHTIGGFRDQIIAGVRFVGGNNLARQFVNNAGSRGAQTLDARQDAYNTEAYVENRFFFLPSVALMTGLKAIHDERIYTDHGGFAGDLTPSSARRDYDGVNPKVGLLWTPRPDLQVFADITRSRDVPDFTDLVQSSISKTSFVPLDAQRGWTAEVGTRGHAGRFGWDVTLYRSWIKDELLQVVTNPVAGTTATFNVANTVHQGVELGVSVDVLTDLIRPQAGDKITIKQLWDYSDFRFVNDPVYGNNKIAGMPDNILRTVISYTHPNGFYFSPQLDWVPQGAYADHANTLRAPGYALLGLQTGVQLPNGTLLFAELRNLLDTHYISDISTIADASKVANLAVFYPGEGRAIYGGVRYAF